MNPVPPIQLSRWLGNIPATPRATQYIASPITEKISYVVNHQMSPF